MARIRSAGVTKLEMTASIAAVPEELADAIALIGPLGRIKERLQLWRDSPVTTLLFSGVRDEPTLRALRDLVRA